MLVSQGGWPSEGEGAAAAARSRDVGRCRHADVILEMAAATIDEPMALVSDRPSLTASEVLNESVCLVFGGLGWSSDG